MDNIIFTGSIIRGVLLGLKSEPWRNDATKFNHKLAIEIKTSNGFGGFVSSVKLLDTQAEDLPKVQELVSTSSGLLIEVPFTYLMKTIKNYSFLEEKIPAGFNYKLLQKPVPVIKKAS